jgi:hypothetical protein
VGDFFDMGGTESGATILPAQRRVLQMLRDYFTSNLGDTDQLQGQVRTALSDLIPQLLRDTTDESKAMSERMFLEGLINPAMKNYKGEISDQIDLAFAGQGATMSSRRGQAHADVVSNIYEGGQAQIAQMLPAIHSFPLQQTLGQIQGLSGIGAFGSQDINQAMQFALQGTQQYYQESAGPGWALLGDLINAGGYMGGMGMANGSLLELLG